ncbi:MAG: MFS transporter [Halobacteriales archaeon]|nr:MFS transporter [Halobacteriales archaeon]
MRRLRGLFARYLGGFQRPVYIVSAGQFLNVLGGGIVYPFATLFFVDYVGIAFTLVGTGLFANSVMRALGTALGGYLADRIGRVPVMVTSMALSAIALAAYALVETALAFIAVAGIAGLVGGLYTPASHAMVADLTQSDDRERAYALLKVANNTGFGLGFVVGGFLFGIARRAVFIVDGATSGIVALILFLTLPRQEIARTARSLRGELTQWGRSISDRRLLWLALLNVGFSIAYAQMQSTVPVFAKRTLSLSSEQLGTLFVLNPLVIVLFQLPVVDRIREWRRTRGLLLSTGFWAASFGAIILAHVTTPLIGIGLVGAFLVLRTIGEVLHSPLTTALASDLGSASSRGSQLSVIAVAKRVGFGIGPVIGGLFFDYGVEPLLWPALIGMCGCLAIGVLLLETRVTTAENGVVTAS